MIPASPPPTRPRRRINPPNSEGANAPLQATLRLFELETSLCSSKLYLDQAQIRNSGMQIDVPNNTDDAPRPPRRSSVATNAGVSGNLHAIAVFGLSPFRFFLVCVLW